MREDIINNLNKLFSGSIDTVKVTYHATKSHDVIRFTMLGHGIKEDDGLITVFDDKDNDHITSKEVNIDPLAVDSVTYEDDTSDGMGISGRDVAIRMADGSMIEFRTVGMG